MENIGADDYTAADLRNWLKELGMQRSGNKAKLATRLNGVPPEARGVCPKLHPRENSETEAGSEELGTDDGIEEVDAEAASLVAQNISTSQNHVDVPEVSPELESMKRQLELLQLENELLKLEVSRRQPLNSVTASSDNEMPQNNVASSKKDNVATSDFGNVMENTKSNATLSNNNSLLAMAKEMLPIFDGADSSNMPVKTWIAQLNAITKIYKLSDDVIRMLVMSKLKDRAQVWLHSEENLLTLPAPELLTQLANVFHCKESKIMSRRKFQERKWIYTEDFSTYFNDKTRLASHIRMDDEELIDNIIEGIPDTLLRQQAHMHCFNSSSQLLQAFAKVVLRRPPSFGPGRPKVAAANGPGQMLNTRCFNCNSVGHFAADCRKPKREFGACYACGSLEHLVSQCTEKKNPKSNEYNA